MIDLDALKALEKAATPGPWVDEGRVGLRLLFVGATPGMRKVAAYTADGTKEQRKANAALIAAMRNALPALIERLEKAERELAAAQTWIEKQQADLTP